MCGIAGIVSANGNALPDEAARPAMQAMLRAMAHRGPDAEGVWTDGRGTAILGHRRLSIIDPDPASGQPMTDPAGQWSLAYNGEIFNYRELREQLGAHPFRTRGDAEVLLAAWMQWGAASLDRLEGMFAFALWNSDRQELVLARDRFGEKPVYYYVTSGGDLVFASEVRALLASGLVPRKLNATALADHLRHGAVHGPATLVQDVRMLLPGHILRFSKGQLSTEPWWDLAAAVDRTAAEMDKQTVLNEVRERFFQAVQKRLVADVPFGAFLSGGIDSSAVVAAMAQASHGRVRTFTVTFDEAEYSEARYARMVAEKFGTKHTEVRLKPQDMLRWLPEALAAMDHPSADGPNTWVVSKMTKEAGISMALSGLGGDEVFAGYEIFKRSLALMKRRRLAAVPRPLRALIGRAVKMGKPGPAGWKAAELLKLPDWDVPHTYPLSRLTLSDGQLRRLLKGPVEKDVVAADVRTWLAAPEARHLEPLAQVSLAELSTYIPDVLLRDADQMAMAHALEVRSPFIDHDLVGFVLGVPDDIKYPHTPKQLLTDALHPLLPREVTHRPKMGFTLPWKQWMHQELHGYCESRIMALAKRPQFNEEGVQALWKGFLAGKPDASFVGVWTLVALQEWLAVNRVDWGPEGMNGRMPVGHIRQVSPSKGDTCQ